MPLEGGLGPELAAAVSTWTPGGTGTQPTVDGAGAHFVSASNSTYIEHVVTAPGELADNATYEVRFTMANRTDGSARALVYGATTNHLGATTSVSANGEHVFRVTTSATGSLADRIRIQATGASGTNNFDITNVSLKRVL